MKSLFGGVPTRSSAFFLLSVAASSVSCLVPVRATATTKTTGHVHYRAAAGFDVSVVGSAPENTVAYVIPVGLVAKPARSSSVVKAVRVVASLTERKLGLATSSVRASVFLDETVFVIKFLATPESTHLRVWGTQSAALLIGNVGDGLGNLAYPLDRVSSFGFPERSTAFNALSTSQLGTAGTSDTSGLVDLFIRTKPTLIQVRGTRFDPLISAAKDAWKPVDGNAAVQPRSIVGMAVGARTIRDKGAGRVAASALWGVPSLDSDQKFQCFLAELTVLNHKLSTRLIGSAWRGRLRGGAELSRTGSLVKVTISSGTSDPNAIKELADQLSESLQDLPSLSVSDKAGTQTLAADAVAHMTSLFGPRGDLPPQASACTGQPFYALAPRIVLSEP